MHYDIQYRPSFSLAVISLGAGETIQAETGAMVSMSDTIRLETGMQGGGILGGLRRAVLGGESFFINRLTANAPGEVTVAPFQLSTKSRKRRMYGTSSWAVGRCRGSRRSVGTRTSASGPTSGFAMSSRIGWGKPSCETCSVICATSVAASTTAS